MRRVFILAAAFGLFWLVGLGLFINTLPKPGAEGIVAHDGVIVYTGGGGARISAAMSIFAQGAGKRLLISGVNPDTSKERLSELWTGAPDMFDCCVDLGHEARSTDGNAEEAAEWAKANSFSTFILVTSDYHMPRAVIATRKRMPNARITPYPVASGSLGANGWPNSLTAWRRVSGEYGKFLFARVSALTPASEN